MVNITCNNKKFKLSLGSGNDSSYTATPAVTVTIRTTLLVKNCLCDNIQIMALLPPKVPKVVSMTT